jgi:hypothetical protein
MYEGILLPKRAKAKNTQEWKRKGRVSRGNGKFTGNEEGKGGKRREEDWTHERKHRKEGKEERGNLPGQGRKSPIAPHRQLEVFFMLSIDRPTDTVT